MPSSSSHRWPLAGAVYHRVPDDTTIMRCALAAACSALCRPARLAVYRQKILCADQHHCRLKLSLTRLTGAEQHVKTLPLWKMDASKTNHPWIHLPLHLSYQHPASTYLACEAHPSWSSPAQ